MRLGAAAANVLAVQAHRAGPRRRPARRSSAAACFCPRRSRRSAPAPRPCAVPAKRRTAPGNRRRTTGGSRRQADVRHGHPRPCRQICTSALAMHVAAARHRRSCVPKLTTISRSATDSSACTTCSIQTIVTPEACTSRIAASSDWHSRSVSPPAISSSSSSFGSVASARASLQPLALQQRQRTGQAVGLGLQPGEFQHLRPRGSPATHPCASRPKVAPTSTFSNTVMPPNGCGIWKDARYATPATLGDGKRGDVLTVEEIRARCPGAPCRRSG